MHSHYGTNEKNNGGVPNFYFPNGYQQQPTTFLTQPRKNYWSSSENCIIPTYHKPDNIRKRYGNSTPVLPATLPPLNNQPPHSYSASQNLAFTSVMENGRKDSFYGLQQVYTSHVSGPTVLFVEPSTKKKRSIYFYLFLIALIAIFLLMVTTVEWQKVYKEIPINVPVFNPLKRVKIVMSMDDDSEASLENVDQ